jgi:hypothetical protein
MRCCVSLNPEGTGVSTEEAWDTIANIHCIQNGEPHHPNTDPGDRDADGLWIACEHCHGPVEMVTVETT